MRKFIFILVMITHFLCSYGQGFVRGTVKDKQLKETLPYVNVRLFHLPDTTIYKAGVTDSKGAFYFEALPNGNYQLSISYMGYKTTIKSFSINANNRAVDLSTLYLEQDQRTLKEVTVTGQRSQMKLEVDRKTFSVDQVLAAAGGSASDILENIPSVEITTDGEISLRGNTSVEVWINGKASGMTSDNRAEILQQIPAESIERIEVIDNPSAKYSPEGSAGIINIILKRDRKAGYYGSLRASIDTNGGWNTGGNINYSGGKIDFFANLGVRKHKDFGGSKGNQTYFNTETYQQYETENKNNGRNIFARGGVSWHPSKRDELSLSGMTMLGKRDNTSLTPYYYGTIGAKEYTSMMFRRNDSEGDMNMYHGEFDYTHTFAENHKIDLNVSYDRGTNDDENYYQDSTTYFSLGNNSTKYSWQFRPMYVRSHSWEIKLDYENAISENIKIECGYNGRFSYENTPQESWIDSLLWTGENAVEDEQYFNRFIYDMDVHALYFTSNFKFGSFGIMAGLRGEWWQVYTQSYTYEQEHNIDLRDSPYKKHHFQLFPSLFLNYTFTQTTQLQLNYTRRLRRPWGGELNSFKNTRDATMVQFGNPELSPEYTNALSLNLLKSWTAHTLSLGGYFRQTSNVIQQVKYNEGNIMYSTNENVSNSISSGIELILKDKLFGSILDLTTTVNAYYYKLNGFTYNINNTEVSGDADESFSWDARLLASVLLPWDISAQITGNYRSRRVISQGYRSPNASLDIGLRKTFLNKKIAFAINCRDVLGTRRFKSYTSDDDFERIQSNWRDPRVNFILTWNFGNMTKKKSSYSDDDMSSGDDDSNYGNY